MNHKINKTFWTRALTISIENYLWIIIKINQAKNLITTKMKFLRSHQIKKVVLKVKHISLEIERDCLDKIIKIIKMAVKLKMTQLIQKWWSAPNLKKTANLYLRMES